MRNLILAIALILAITSQALAQIVRLPTGTSLPATCTTGDAFEKTNGILGSKFYLCISTNTWELQGGLADPGANGILARTSAGTTTARTLTGTSGNIVIIAGDGSGVPTFDVGTTIVQTDQGNTYTTGDQNFASASSFTFPTASGAAPTTSGRCAYDNTANRLKCGFNGGTVTLAVLSEVQPLSANLTALSVLTGSNNTWPMFSGVGSMVLVGADDCPDTGGNHWNYDAATRNIICGTSSTGGISGLTTNTYPVAASATSLTNGLIAQSGGVITIGGGLVVGLSPFLIIDTSAIASSDKTLTAINVSGTLRPTTGAITTDHVVAFAADGSLKDGGVAGTGTWTDTSTNTAQNKTIADAAAGGTGNSLTLPISAFWDAASLTLPSTSTCSLAAVATINSGPSIAAVNCTDASTSTFEGQLTLKQAVTTVTFTMTVNDVDSSSQHFAGDFSAMCRNNNTTVNNTWGTSQSVDITMTTASNNYTGTTSAVTPNGTCTAGATLFWRFIVNTTPFTDDGDARVLGVLMKQAS